MVPLGLASCDSTFGIRASTASTAFLVALGLALNFSLGRELADTQMAMWATLLLAISPGGFGPKLGIDHRRSPAAVLNGGPDRLPSLASGRWQ